MTSTIPGRWLAACLCFSVLATCLMLIHARQTVALGPSGFALIAGGIMLVAIRMRFRDPVTRAQRIARDAAEYVGAFALVSLLGALISYPEASMTAGFVDPSLERIDRFFRFDWVAWYEVVATHPILQMLGRAAYAGIFVSPTILLGYFAFVDRKPDARRLILSFWLGALLTLIWFPRVPAVGPLAFLWHGAIPYMPTSALFQAQLLPQLRDHVLHVVDIGALRGIVCTPSFHTTSAMLYMAAAWRVRVLRVPLVVLNCAMLLSTPVEGTHYLADMLGGALVAAVALVLTTLTEIVAAEMRSGVLARARA
jgi:hypothetical protein